MRTTRLLASMVIVVAGLASSARANAQTQWTMPGAAPSSPQPPPQVGTPPASEPSPSAAPYGQPMEAGGLTPPPPMTAPTTPTPPPENVEQRLDAAKEKDSGRGLTWVWLDVQGGFEHVGLQTFNVDEENFTAGFVDSSSSGGVIGIGLGARLLFVTIGARARLGFFSAWQLFSIGGELGAHIPIGNLEPHVDLGFGYTGLGSFKGAVSGANDSLAIRGFDARIGAGLDYFITPIFSVGGNVSWEFLGLTRPGVSPSEIERIQREGGAEAARAQALAAEGSGYGSAIAVTAVAGLHF